MSAFIGYVLVVFFAGTGTAVIPEPYISRDACIYAMHEVYEHAREGTDFVCVPVGLGVQPPKDQDNG